MNTLTEQRVAEIETTVTRWIRENHGDDDDWFELRTGYEDGDTVFQIEEYRELISAWRELQRIKAGPTHITWDAAGNKIVTHPTPTNIPAVPQDPHV